MKNFTSSKITRAPVSPCTWPIKFILLLYIGSMYAGMTTAATSSTAGSSPATDLDGLALERTADELAPEIDCLTEECPQEVVHQVVARGMDRIVLPPQLNQLVYSLLRELESANGGSSHFGGQTNSALNSIPLPIAQMLMQRLHDHPAVGLIHEAPIAITPIRKQRGNQLKMANRFGKRDRLRMSNRFGRK